MAGVLSRKKLQYFYIKVIKPLTCKNRMEDNMARKDKKIVVSNTTPEQYAWVEEEAERIGANMSMVIKIMIQKEVEKQSTQDKEK